MNRRGGGRGEVLCFTFSGSAPTQSLLASVTDGLGPALVHPGAGDGQLEVVEWMEVCAGHVVVQAGDRVDAGTRL